MEMTVQNSITKSKYQPYSVSDLDILMHEPWEISDRPFMLHAAYALSCLFETFLTDSEESEDTLTPDDMWGFKISQRILDRLVFDIESDFNDAASNYKQVRIWGKAYSIRKLNAYDHNRLHLIFNFPLSDGEYTVTKDGIMDLHGIVPNDLKKYEISCEQAKANRIYLRQIIKLAEDDKNNGWDKLTDMEIIAYCWALFYNKDQSENWLRFKNEYKDYFYVNEPDILECFNEKASLRQGPVGMYTFSKDKIQKWNETNDQKSVAANMPEEEADNYWYDVALQSTFKPIDLR